MEILTIKIDAGGVTCNNCEWLRWRTSGAIDYKIPLCGLWGGNLASSKPKLWVPLRCKQCLLAGGGE